MKNINDNVTIVPFDNRYSAQFKRLNLEWLEKYSLLEPADLKYLDNPREHIIDQGGRILIALANGAVVGTCAIIKEQENTAEFAKLAVSPSARGKGIGRLLTTESIKQIKEMGFRKIIIVSNKKLNAAVKLYESLGFIHVPVPKDIVYKTADVYMVLKI